MFLNWIFQKNKLVTGKTPFVVIAFWLYSFILFFKITYASDCVGQKQPNFYFNKFLH